MLTVCSACEREGYFGSVIPIPTLELAHPLSDVIFCQDCMPSPLVRLKDFTGAIVALHPVERKKILREMSGPSYRVWLFSEFIAKMHSLIFNEVKGDLLDWQIFDAKDIEEELLDHIDEEKEKERSWRDW